MSKQLPRGWKEFALKDIGNFLRGSGISKKDLSDTGIPAIRYGDIYTKYDFVIKNVSSFTNSKGTELKKGDILFAGSGETAEEIGKSVAFIDDYKAFAGGDIIIFRPNIDLNSLFLSYILNSGKCRKDISIMGQGHTVVHIYASSLEILKVILPPLDEQKRIADILSTFDDLIENLTKLIEKKEIYKKGVMQRVLTGDVRFNGFKDEWREVYIKDVGTIITGNTPSTKDKSFWGGKHVWVTPTDINKKDIDNSERKLTDIGLSKARKLPKNTLLVTCIASIGKNSILRCEGSCNQQINAIIPNKNFSAEFLYYIFENNKEYLNAKAPASATKIISKTEFEKLSFILPKIEEQNKIAELLTLIDKDIEILKQLLHLRKLQKKGVMQKLLTGEVRI